MLGTGNKVDGYFVSVWTSVQCRWVRHQSKRLESARHEGFLYCGLLVTLFPLSGHLSIEPCRYPDSGAMSGAAPLRAWA